VVITLDTAVKELIENSIDAGATSIEISFTKHGYERIELTDNGCGIEPENHASIATRHWKLF